VDTDQVGDEALVLLRAFVGSPEEHERASRDVRATNAALGCQAHEVTRRYGRRYGALRVAAIAQAARSGLRGRRALDLALRAAQTSAVSPPRHATARAPRSRRPRSRVRARAPGDDDLPAPPGGAAARVCACGCGRPVTGRPQKIYADARCATRAHVRAHRARRRVAPEERYREAVWEARRDGLLDAEEALWLLVTPSARVLAALGEAAA
jgi:hypothetical protein